MPPPNTSGPPTVRKEYTALGMKVIETDAPLGGPEDQKDFWWVGPGVGLAEGARHVRLMPAVGCRAQWACSSH